MSESERQFVIQFRIEQHGSVEDFDRLIAIEEALDQELERSSINGFVDGHDMGSGEMNIFAYFPSSQIGTEFLTSFVRNQDWALEVVIAEREPNDSYRVFWPGDFSGEFSIS
jgi:hypothetical protein